ncbi:hypothetical protein D3C73_1179540 [compost metagenome]
MIVRDHFLRSSHSSQHSCGFPPAGRSFLCKHTQIKRPFLMTQQVNALLNQIRPSLNFWTQHGMKLFCCVIHFGIFGITENVHHLFMDFGFSVICRNFALAGLMNAWA